MICLMCALEKGKEPKAEAPLKHGTCPYCGRHMILVAEGELRVKSPDSNRLLAHPSNPADSSDMH